VNSKNKSIFNLRREKAGPSLALPFLLLAKRLMLKRFSTRGGFY
jgi:hypothetical protein